MISETQSGGSPPPETKDLQDVLENSFRRSIAALHRAQAVMNSSFALEELEIEFSDGATLAAMFKNVGPAGLFGAAADVKPMFLMHPYREIQVYQEMLPSLRLGTPALYGAVTDLETERYWLIIERVTGRELWQVGEFEVWMEAARWLARLHSAPESSPKRAKSATPLLHRFDETYHHKWFLRANANTGGQLDPYRDAYGKVLKTLQEIPRTFVHGEFYASNVIARTSGDGVAICPVDWEMAGVGPLFMDIAALTTGRWTEAQQLSLLEAFLERLPAHLRPKDPEMALLCCRLQICLQWVGWAPKWNPPKEHARDWLAEAHTLFERLA